MSVFSSVFRAASALLAAFTFCAVGPAHAGLVTGNWDPAFGPSRPGLNWAIQGEFLVPNACSAQADGVYGTASGACVGAETLSLNLRLYNDAADPDDFFEDSANSQVRNLQALSIAASYGGFVIHQVRVLAGQIVGFAAGYTGLAESPAYAYFSNVGESQGNAYGAWLDLLGPSVECFQCGPDEVSIIGEKAGLTQFLTTYDSDDTSAPKFTDDNGRPLGALLDEDGNYLGRFPAPAAPALAVPEPGALALVLAALLAASTAGKRRRG